MRSLKIHEFSKSKNIRQEVLEKNAYKTIKIYVRFQRIFVHNALDKYIYINHKITKSKFYRRYLKNSLLKKKSRIFGLDKYFCIIHESQEVSEKISQKILHICFKVNQFKIQITKSLAHIFVESANLQNTYIFVSWSYFLTKYSIFILD